MTEDQARALARDPWVQVVEQNQRALVRRDIAPSCYDFDDAQAPPDAGSPLAVTTATQVISCDDPDPRNPNATCQDNWGLDRIDQVSPNRDGVYQYSGNGAGVDIYLIDTGVSALHRDFLIANPLLTRVRPGYNAIAGNTSAANEDCHGHGTHVASIAAGTQAGVAKKAWIHPVKFLDLCDPNHQGGMAAAVDGINWVVMTHDVGVDGPALVSFSGGNVNNSGQVASVRVAAEGLINAGIPFVQSAGNHLIDACDRTVEGAGLEAAITVGGSDTAFLNGGWRDTRWLREGPATTGGAPDPSYDDLCPNGPNGIFDCGSNHGTCVDLFAPAAHVFGASHDDTGSYCRLSGTSMAAPFVAGVVANYLQYNSTATPADVHQALLDGATCGVLDDDSASPYYIGAGSPNLLLNADLNGGGPSACAGSPPACQDDTLTVPAGTETSVPFGTLLANDTDPDGDPLYVVDFTQPTTANGGSTQGHASGFDYNPPAGCWTGTDVVDYTIANRPDGGGQTATCRLSMNVVSGAASDSFAGNGPLKGREAETGCGTWFARPGAQTAGGTVRDSAAVGSLPFSLAGLPASTTVALTAKVNPRFATWVAVGFADRPVYPYWAAGELWVLIRPPASDGASATYTVFGPNGSIGNGTVPGGNGNGQHAVDLRYVRSTNRAELRLNGSLMLSQILDGTPNIRHVGFHGFTASEGVGHIDDVAVTDLSSNTVLLADSFSSGRVLHERRAEVGNASWKATRGAIIAGGAVIDSTAIGGLPLDVSALPGEPVIRVAADVRSYGQSWVGLGFASQPHRPYWAKGELWMGLRPDGTYFVYAGGTAIHSGTVPSHHPNWFEHVELAFDTGTKIFTLTINGTQVLSTTVTAALDIRYAGFHMHQPTAGGDRIDNFKVDFTP